MDAELAFNSSVSDRVIVPTVALVAEGSLSL